MYVLALETATSTASVAVMRDGVLLAEQTLCNTCAHSETILPMTEALLDTCLLSPGDLQAIAVDRGPGSFTGVRIGVSIANAMGQALTIPVIGVTSLRVLYEAVGFLTQPVCAMMDARNDTVYTALYQNGVCLREPAAVSMDALLPGLPAGTVCVGDGADVYAARICGEVSGVILASGMPRASALCGAASVILRQGDGLETFQEAVPLYLRPSQAERLYRQQQGGE